MNRRETVALFIGLSLHLCSFAAAGPQASTKENPSILRFDGDAAFKNREYPKAIKLYSSLIKIQPDIPLNHYKRAMVYFMLHRYSDAVKDLEDAILIDPKYATGYLYRGKAFQNIGRLDEAAENFEKVMEIEGRSAELEDTILKVKQASQSMKSFRELDGNDCLAIMPLLSSILAVAAFDVDLLMKRAKCHMKSGRTQNALLDAGRVLKVRPRMLDAYLIRGKVFFSLDQLDMALDQYKNGLRMDPEHKQLKKAFKNLKKLRKIIAAAEEDKEKGMHEDALDGFSRAYDLADGQESISFQILLKQCQVYVQMKKGVEAIQKCSKAIELDESEPDPWGERGDARILEEEFEEAVRDWEKAVELSPKDGRLRRGLDHAKKKLKISQQKDYYKILGDLPRTATERDITKAFRKASKKWHPDRFKQGSDEAKKAEKKIQRYSRCVRDSERSRKAPASRQRRGPQRAGRVPRRTRLSGRRRRPVPFYVRRRPGLPFWRIRSAAHGRVFVRSYVRLHR
eukprot:328942_1